MNIGDVIFEKYRAVSVIGSGGMGQVYLAEDIENGGKFAIKETESTEYNIKEAKILSNLDHIALPKIYRYGELNGLFYIVMEYISGQTLDSFIEQGGAYNEQKILSWYLQLADILRYLHGLNPPIAYRDLKPSNIIISDERYVRLIDFGIAEEYSPEHYNDKKYTALTRGYAAPEQYTLNYDVDVRTDIYALGATMHYLVTGKDPQKPPYKFQDVRRINKSASLAIEHIIEKSLQPEPEKRYQSAENLYTEISGAFELDQELKKKKSKRMVFSIVAVVALICIATTAFGVVKGFQDKSRNNYRSYIDNAMNCAESGDYDGAEENIDRAILVEPNIEDAYLIKAEIYHMQGEDELSRQYLEYTVCPRFNGVEDSEAYKALIDKLEETD